MSNCRRLRDLITIQRGTTYKSGLIGEPGPVILGLGTIQRHGGFRSVNLRTYGGDSPEELLVYPGQIYASLKDVTQTADVLGAVAKVPQGGLVGRLTQDTVRLDFVSDDIPADFVYWILRTPQYRDYCRTHATGTTTMGLPRDDFLAFEVPPPTASRLEVTRLLSALDDKIAANDRLAGTARELMLSRFASLNVDEPGVATLSELVELNPLVESPGSDEAVYLDMKNLPEHAMTVKSWSYRAPRGGARFQNGDTLLARITPCLENGKVGFVDFLSRGEVGVGSTEFIVMRPRDGVPQLFPYLVSVSARFREFAIRHMVGSSGRQRLAAGDLAGFRVRYPGRQELADFTRSSDDLMRRVKAAVDESRTLAATRDELLPLLMAGKLRVRDAEKMVSDAV